MTSPTGPGLRGKPAARRTLLARRDALGERERAEMSARICDAAAALLESRVARGGIVALYAAKGSEVDTAKLDAALRGWQMRVVYPRVVDRSRELAFAHAAPHELVAARFGLREPPADAPHVDVASIAAFVIPGVAFDRAGGRIGWGRGHYDATLARADAHAVRIGLAYECQLVDHVPREAHDALVHVIVTEAATYSVA